MAVACKVDLFLRIRALKNIKASLDHITLPSTLSSYISHMTKDGNDDGVCMCGCDLEGLKKTSQEELLSLG